MSEEEEVQRRQLEGMTIEQMTARIQQNQREIEMFQEELINRAQVQDYTERYANDVLSLLRETLELIWGVPDWLLSPEWVTKRNRLVEKVTKKVEDYQWPKK